MASKSASSTAPMTDDEKVVKQAHARWERCKSWESTARKRFVDDLKFCNGDSDNLYQWPDEQVNNRRNESKPALTINKTRQHCLQIINDGRQNKTSMKVKPANEQASFEAAQVFEGVLRNIEYRSNAQQAYTCASWFQVEGGIGYWRVRTAYISDDSFDQEILIERVKDPLSIFLDPNINEFDGSDANFGFVFEDVDKEEFKAKHPRFADLVSTAALGSSDSWVDKDKVRVAEYFRRVEKADRLLAYTDDKGQQQIIRASKLPAELVEMLDKDPDTKSRPIVDHAVERFLIVGDKIAEKGPWPGKYIPIVRVIGEETVIDGQLDRKGQTRFLKDPNRMYNYWTSEATAQVALQTKTPWLTPMGSTDGLETYWESINRVNYAYVPYQPFDDQGRPLPPPSRVTPAQMAQGYVEGMQAAANEMALASGQYQADFGAPSNERSGVAIQQRQRQGDNATYHFVDNFAVAVRYTALICVDLIPKIYDTRRLLQTMGEDGKASNVLLDPQAQQAYAKKQAITKEAADEVIFNPNIGLYDVEADVGPGFATRRQEAFNALSQIAQHSPQLMGVIGDLVMQAADFPMADEAAQRLKRMVPAQAMGDGPSPAEQQLQHQVQQLQQFLNTVTQKLAEAQKQLGDKGMDQAVDVYDAETKRITSLQKALASDPEGLMALIHQIVQQALSTGAPGGQPPMDAPGMVPAMPPQGPAPMPGGAAAPIPQ
jgi:hypothetical protein